MKKTVSSQYHTQFQEIICYHTATKYGKLFNKIDESDNPFKQPIIMMEPGAILEKEARNTLSDGVIRNIHRNEKIIHCAIPFLVPVNIEQEVQK